MSSGNLYVRFPDGTIRYGIYHGTADVARPALYLTPNEAWDRRNTFNEWDAGWSLGEGVRVAVATDYGHGFAWEGTATPAWLTSGHEPRCCNDGLPDWARCPEAVPE